MLAADRPSVIGPAAAFASAPGAVASLTRMRSATQGEIEIRGRRQAMSAYPSGTVLGLITAARFAPVDAPLRSMR
jgi:hypothetical protein